MVPPVLTALMLAFLVFLALLVPINTSQFQFVGQQLQNTTWQNETVWSPTGVPNSTDTDAVISLPKGHLLKISQQVQLHNLTFSGGDLQGSAGVPLRMANLVLLSGSISGMPIFTSSFNTSLCKPQDRCAIGLNNITKTLDTNTSLTIDTEWVNEGDVILTNTTMPSFTNLGTCTNSGALNTTSLTNHNSFSNLFADITTTTLVNHNVFNSSFGSITTTELINYKATNIFGALLAPTVYNYGNLTLQSAEAITIQKLVQYSGYTRAISYTIPVVISSFQVYGGDLHLASSNTVAYSPTKDMDIFGDVKLTIGKNSYQVVINLFLANNATLQLDYRSYEQLQIYGQTSLQGVLDVSLFTRPSYPWVNGISVFKYWQLDYNATLKGNEIVVDDTVVGQYVANYTDASQLRKFILQPDVGYYLNLTPGGGNIPAFNMSLTFAQLMSHPASNVNIQFQLVSDPSFMLDFSPNAVTNEEGLASVTINTWPEDATTITIRAFVTGCYSRKDNLCSNVVELVFSSKQASKGLSAGAIFGIVISVLVAVGAVVFLAVIYTRNRDRQLSYQSIQLPRL